MSTITDLNELAALYGTPKPPSLRKVVDRMVPVYRRWIMASRFCVLTTVGPDGTDGSPRGDDGPVVIEIDEHTLAMPDWRGNNRLDSLRNIVQDGRVSLMFMVPGSDLVVRVNGRARLTIDPDHINRFDLYGKRPTSVILIDIAEIYVQCARALARSDLWTSGDQSDDLPTLGDILKEVTSGEIGGAEFDTEEARKVRESLS
ncbi:MAG: pyridoxamine 5'-phosphate oxidase family protein [Silicimonas sp.]|nr:pyridoxamine 5'-phosphate oxidase family protein [Silicimonas sp.]